MSVKLIKLNISVIFSLFFNDEFSEIDYLCNQMKLLFLNIIKWFLPFLFISYLAGITLFTHSHVVNGVTIVHSHPFKQTSSHGHTTVEFQLIHLLNQVVSTNGCLILLSFALAIYFLSLLLWRLQTVRYTVFCRGILCLRAPPSNRF